MHVACYSAKQLEKAYHLRGLYAIGFTGRGRTIVIVDPFGSPTIRHDLGVFDHRSGLPAPPSFRVLAPVGRVPPYNPNDPAMTGKAAETTGDVELAHAFAPGADILLVETPVAETDNGGGFPKMLAAEDYVIRHNLGDVISQSFSLPEENLGHRLVASLRYAYRDAYRHRVSVLAASNDFGVTGPSLPSGAFYKHRVVYWPASDPLVTAVGGTRLHLDAAGKRTSSDTAWNDSHSLAVSTSVGPEPWASNGGLSKLFARPAYQDALRRIVGDRRGVPDVAVSAAFRGGTPCLRIVPRGLLPRDSWLVYRRRDECRHPGLRGHCGDRRPVCRSAAGFPQPGALSPRASACSRRRRCGQGNNTVTFALPNGEQFRLKGYRAKPGYDLVTGLGTVDASRLVPELARRR